MRLLVILVCVAVATANPLKSMNAKAIEPVDQHLDSLRPLESGSGQNVERAKKDVTFCVEVRQDSNKPVVVDCGDRQPIQPQPAVIPGPAPAPEPQPEAQPSQPDVQPQPIVIPNGQPSINTYLVPGGHGASPSFVLPGGHGASPSFVLPAGHGGLQHIVLPGGQAGVHPGFTKPQPHTLNIEVPCEPEMAAYVVQPPEQVVYAPTGNCFPQVPSVVQVPTAPGTAPAATAPAATAPAGGTAPAQVLHIQTGHGIHGLHGHHGVHGVHTLHGGHGLHQTIKPLHTQVVQPTIVQPSAALPTHLHNGVECTCHSTPGILAKSADAPMMSNEALAMKFLQDLQKNAGASGQPMIISGSAPTATMQGSNLGTAMQGSVPGVAVQGSVPGVAIQGSVPGVAIQGSAPGVAMPSLTPGATMRYLPMRPTMTMPSQMSYAQSSSMAGSGMNGMYPNMGGHMMYPGMMRMHPLEDSFTTGPMLPSVRACREDAEKTAADAGVAQQQEAKAVGTEADAGKSTPKEVMEQMKKIDKDDKLSRIARFIAEKDEAENRLDDN